MSAKIDDFDYQAEEAKINFQANIGSILELQNLLNSKLTAALENKKEGSFCSNDELKIMSEWLMQATTNLMADYTILNRSLMLTNKLYKCAMQISLKRTPNLKDLAA